MARVFFSNKVPEDIRKIEWVINLPNFIEEVEKCKKFESNSSKHITSSGHLRSIFKEIQEKYDPKFNYWSCIPVNNYVGLQYNSTKDLAAIVTKIVTSHSKSTIYEYIRYQINHRPKDVRVIYMIAPERDKKIVELFKNEGVPEVDESGLYEELNFKTGNNVVGNTDLSTTRKERIYEEVVKTQKNKEEKEQKPKKKEKKLKKEVKEND